MNGERSRLVKAKARKRLDWTRLSTVGGVPNGHLNVGGERLLHELELAGEVLDIIRLLARDGMTMLVVTHEVGFAREVADEVVFMNEGVVAEQVPPSQMLQEPLIPRRQWPAFQ